jgi:phosphoserine phosphatase
MTHQRSQVAIYDLDRTITRRPTYSLFLLRSAWRIAPARLFLAPVVPLLMLLYALRLIPRGRLKEYMWALLLGRVDPAAMEDAVAAFTDHVLRGNICPGALRQIGRDREAGTLLVMATAAHEIYALPIARALGFNLVVATRCSPRADGRHGPQLDGGNVYGVEKLAALIRALDKLPLARAELSVTFYSDSASDAPVFGWCDVPVAVNPSRRLESMAAERGWAVEQWNAERDRPSPASWASFKSAAMGQI